MSLNSLLKMYRLKVIVLTVYTLHFASAFTHHEESIYNWGASVKTGTFLPIPHVSLLTLNGKIHFQPHNGTTYVKLSNLSYKMYNGILDHSREHRLQDLPLPHAAKELENIFQIVYDDDSLVEKIVTQKGEKEFSRNIKRAIASIFQVNSSIVNREYHHPETFIVRENSLYGNLLVDYTVYPRGKEKTEVHKMYDMPDSELDVDYTQKIGTYFCYGKSERPVMQNSRKVYTISNDKGNRIVTQIKSVGIIKYYPFQAKSDALNIVINQTFDLAEIVPRKEEYHMDTLSEQSLNYHQYYLLEDDIIDATNGRHNLTYEQIKPTLVATLKDIPVYLHENHINTKNPDTFRGQAINRAQRLLSLLNLEKLQDVEKHLDDDALKVFHHILPLVDTKASALYIKTLIMGKKVDDDLAVELLQKLPDYANVSVELLGELEELIHLNESFSWEVRKVAILTFGSLIHKSYLQSKSRQSQPYQKYVDEYASKMKNSQLYRIQMVYILGLCNMQITGTLKYLIPAFNGELWSDHHLRFLSLYAAGGPLMDADPDTVFVTLWPIFSNPDERSDMRMAAFYSIMGSRPSHSRLKNLLAYLLKETNDEVHRFCYTYIQSVLKSNNPCIEELKLRLAQMLKSLPPPRGGTSSTTIYGYTDSKFGFGMEVHDYVINTKESRIHGIVSFSYDYDKFQEEDSLYVKIRNDYRHATSMFSLPSFYLSSVTGTKVYTRIEGALLKHGKIINTFYSDKDYAHDITDHWIFQEKVVNKNILNIYYQKYRRVLLPTDVGFPAVFDFLQPHVRQNQIHRILKGKTMNIDYRYVNWVNSRHGLIFYNPLAAVWQGINKGQSYDETWPLSLELSWYSKELNGGAWYASIFELPWNNMVAGIRWKRSREVAGIRSHVKLMLFVQDDHRSGVLTQSCPHCDHFHDVGDDRRFRHNYTFVDVDDFNTGHKLHVGLFDSDDYISNGTFKHLLARFAQTYTKQAHTPVSHMVLSLINWRQYVLLSPHPGTYGFILQVLPSEMYNISDVYASYYGNKSEYELGYAVGNRNQVLKAWVANISANVNVGRTFEIATLNLTRMVPGQKKYRVCAEAMKKVSQEETDGHLNIEMGQIEDDVCPSDSTVRVTVKSERSSEQINGNYKYAACQYAVPYFLKAFNTSECLASASTLRKYEYVVKTKDLPSELKKSIVRWWDRLVGYYRSYYTVEEQDSDNLAKGDVQIQLKFPMQAKEIDVQVRTSQDVHDLNGIPVGYWSWFGVSPDNIKSPRLLFDFTEKKKMNKCIVYPNKRYFNDKSVADVVPKDWTLYLQDGETKFIYLKGTSNNTLAFKTVYSNITLEVNPKDESFHIVVNGEQRSADKHFEEEGISYRSFIKYGQPSDFSYDNGVSIEYGINYVTIFQKKFDEHKGLCSEE